jgi:hypothetical protein
MCSRYHSNGYFISSFCAHSILLWRRLRVIGSANDQFRGGSTSRMAVDLRTFEEWREQFNQHWTMEDSFGFLDLLPCFPLIEMVEMIPLIVQQPRRGQLCEQPGRKMSSASVARPQKSRANSDNIFKGFVCGPFGTGPFGLGIGTRTW